jgi:biotin-(acetyl-CoA carboxylase) ligase
VQENKKLTGLFYDLDEEGRLVLKSENGELSKIVTGDIVI